jgi:methionyl-tRNA formyltransferase
MKILFFGTGTFAVPALRALAESDHQVLAVVTQPDRPSGRKRTLTPPPVKIAAEALDLPVLQPEKVNHCVEEIAAYGADAVMVADYGQILSSKLLDVCPFYNIHGSVLPRYRGASPVAAAILNGDPTTGVTVFRIVREMDAGPIVATRSEPIRPMDTTGSLRDRLADLGAALSVEVLGGERAEVEQDHGAATFAPKLEKAQGWLNWELPAEILERRIRAFQPWPGAYTMISGERAGVLSARVVDASGVPGTVLQVDRAGLVVACGDGALSIQTLQPAGKKPMEMQAFLNGRAVSTGDLLGQ